MSAQPSHEIDLDIQRVVLDVVSRKLKGLDTRIDASIIDGELERTIEGASTLTITVHDPKRALLQSGMFDQAIQVRLDRLYWRLVKVGKIDTDLTLVFEDREVSYLRQHFKPKKASRSKVTRAQFALSLVREVKAGGGIKFVCPELKVKQPVISSKRQKKKTSKRREEREKGLATDVELTIKGKAATASQRRNAERVLDVADSANAGQKATLALMAACIVESLVNNLPGGDRDSRGILQVRDQTARGMRINNRDMEACANAFLTRGFWGKGGAIDLARKNPSRSAGWVAQQTQGSAYPERYDQVLKEAARFVNAYEGGGVELTTSTERTRVLPFQFRRGTADGARENSWTCLQRLAEEVKWRCFMSAGRLYFISEDQLMKAKPRFVLSEQTPGIHAIDFDIDQGKVTSEVQVTARASRWAAGPGTVVQLKDCGPANGRWLVANIRRGLFDATATISLKRPTHKLKEPAAETVQKTTTTKSFTSQSSRLGDRAYEAAKSITDKNYSYVWGGGHAKCGVADGGVYGASYKGFDCSGGVCAVLGAAKMGFKSGGGTTDAAGLTRWGESGKGETMTVYAKGGHGSQDHTFIIFHTSGGDKHFGTGFWGAKKNGAALKPNMHPTSGFEPRHWPGT